ncbi:hypothetical protein A3SK_0101860 [Pseudomonas amygdali pv. tabaci str. 6605]|nr:hypothetical protein A3SK_0101860 [Pseudomonas amygdali pv. tabaci str. 6605]
MHKFTDARISIEETEGGQLWQAIKELDDTVWIFKSSAEDLFQIINLFAQKTQDPGFWEPTNRTNAEHFTREVKRKLFYSTTSVMALVEVSRVFHKKHPVAGFTEKLGRAFPLPGCISFFKIFGTIILIGELLRLTGGLTTILRKEVASHDSS